MRSFAETIKGEGFRKLSVEELCDLMSKADILHNITVAESFANPDALLGVRKAKISWNRNRFRAMLCIGEGSWYYMNIDECTKAGLYEESCVHMITSNGNYVKFRLHEFKNT